MRTASTEPAEPSVPALAHALADRLRTLPESRWRRPVGARTVASAALEVAQLLADLTAALEARIAETAPVQRSVPDLGVFALPDQIAVVATDLWAALNGAEGDAEIWGPDGDRVPLTDALQRAQSELRALSGEV
ncbi:MAG: hypothetical protein ACT4QF_06050 [Sporichthyaceae bacterium]